MGKLAISLGSLPILAVEIGTKAIRLGRSADNDIVLPLPDVADAHAELSEAGEVCEVRALPSESLRVQGRMVTMARLRPGDELALGGYCLRWIGAGAGSALSEPALDLAAVRSHGTKPLEPVADTPGRVTEIRVIDGGRPGPSTELRAQVSTIGRSPDCDLVLEDETVSWRHCCLELTRGGVRVRDLGSRNGTWLDGRRVESALAGAGSRVRVGETTLELVSPARAPQTEAVSGLAELIGSSPPMQELYARIRDAAASRLPVLIVGETGSGKELAARAIHSGGPRSRGPFVPVNCAAIPGELLEAELFGFVRGAFTGASADRAGAFERADEGTIFLDEVGALPLALQPKILRVLEDGEVPRLGGEAVRSDFRILAATNADLAEAVPEGRFRQDLYYRLAVLQIAVPPLRERGDDLPDLVQHFLGKAATESGLASASGVTFDREALRRLGEHAWPGNVRELKNLVLRAVLESQEGVVDDSLAARLVAESPDLSPAVAAKARTLEEFEAEVIRKTLEDCGGQRRATARRLGIAESTLYEKIRKYDLAEVGH